MYRRRILVSVDNESLWRREEMEWWERYASIMTYQWKLTPELNNVLRKDLENDYARYLFKPDGRLLDLGCGSGWLSIFFAERGMSVLGIDFSQEQVEAAEKQRVEKGLDSVHFECCDLVHWDCVQQKEVFDSIFVNAFLHHLPSIDIETIMKKIADVLKPGGRVYLYEPMTSLSQKKSLFLKSIEYTLNKIVGLLIGRFPKWFNLWTPHFQSKLTEGYAGSSPHERPLDIEWMKIHCLKSLSIAEVKCWHLYSLSFAMQAMVMKPSIQFVYFRMACLLYRIDRVILSRFDWKQFADQKRFILCSLKLEKS